MRLARTRKAVSGFTFIFLQTSFISQKLAREKKRLGHLRSRSIEGYRPPSGDTRRAPRPRRSDRRSASLFGAPPPRRAPSAAGELGATLKRCRCNRDESRPRPLHAAARAQHPLDRHAMRGLVLPNLQELRGPRADPTPGRSRTRREGLDDAP